MSLNEIHLFFSLLLVSLLPAPVCTRNVDYSKPMMILTWAKAMSSSTICFEGLTMIKCIAHIWAGIFKV